MADSTSEVVLIFVKNPEEGRVKTRLGQTIGHKKALSVYQKLLQITKSVTDPLDVRRQVWYSRFIEEDDLWPPDEYEKKLQRGDTLGARMKEAFRQAFAGGFGKVVVIGSDCAELDAAILRKAFQNLQNYEVVIGPARDGGYYLLGMSAFYPVLFEQKKWSTASVYEQTIRQLTTMEVSYHTLPVLNDIDTAEDLRASGIDIAKSDR